MNIPLDGQERIQDIINAIIMIHSLHTHVISVHWERMFETIKLVEPRHYFIWNVWTTIFVDFRTYFIFNSVSI